MQAYRNYKIILCFLMMSGTLLASNRDSLLTIIRSPKTELSKAIATGELAWELLYVNPDSSMLLSGQAIHLLNDLLLKDPANNGMRKELATNYSVLGMGYLEKGNYAKALEGLFTALRIDEKINNKKGIATRYGNIGIVYAEEQNYKKALAFYQKALAIDKEIKNLGGVERHYANIGNVYSSLHDFPTSLEYYFKALKINEESKNRIGLANNLGNIGIVYKEMGDLEKGLSYYKQATKIIEETGNISQLVINQGNIGSLYIEAGNLTEAEKYIKRSLQLSRQIGSIDDEMLAVFNLSELYAKKGDFKSALNYYKMFINARDTIVNAENTKKQTRLEMQYDFDKQQAADSIKNIERIKQENLKHEAEIKQQKIYTYGGIAGFTLMLIVAFVSFRGYRQKQKANYLIAQQKNLVEKKQKEILDSIHYAKRIQQALLPSKKYIARKIDDLKNTR